MGKIDISNIILQTSRLILRPFCNDDLDDFYEYARVEGVGEMAGWVHHKDILESKTILDSFIESKNQFAIVYKENNKVIGSLGLEDKTYSLEELNNLNGIEIGYTLSKDYWGKGIMTEATKKVIFYIFLELNLDYITCGYFKRNIRSKRVYEKNNFKHLTDVIYKTRYDSLEDTNVGIIYRNDYLSRIEKIKLYDLDGNSANKWLYRGLKSPNGYLAGVVDIIIKNTKYDKYLMTKRDKNKETYPNYYETTGGSIIYGEKEIDAAKREIFEETGIKEINLSFLYTYKTDNNIFFEYYGECSCELSDVILQEGETSEYVWLSKEEYLEIWESDIAVNSQRIRLSKAINTLLR